MKNILFFIGILSVALFSCKTDTNIQQPEFRDIRNVRLVETGVINSTAGVDLLFSNPNSFGLTLDDARGDFYLNDKFMGKISLADKVKINRNADFVIPALLKIDMVGTALRYKEFMKMKEAKVRIDGTARLKKAGFVKTIPIKFEEVQDIDKIRAIFSMK